MKKLDILIIGAGAAGLILAKNLHKEFNLLVIEKEKSFTSKTWLTKKSLLKENNLEKYITMEFKKYFISTAKSKKKIFVDNDYCSVDEKGICESCIQEIGANIHYNEEFIQYKNKKNYIEVKTSKNIYECKLIVDCSGVHSKIARGNHLYKHELFHNIYGEIYNYSMKNEEINMFSVYLKEKPNIFFEAVPISKSKCVAYTFHIGHCMHKIETLKHDHQLHIACFDKIHHTKLQHKIDHIEGTIPLRTMKTNALDRIVFFGDSSNIVPPFSGVGFSYILKHNKTITEHIKKCLISNKLSKKDLRYKLSKEENLSFNCYMIIARIFQKLNIDEIDELFISMNDLSSEIIDSLFINTLTKKHFYSLLKLVFTNKIYFKIIIKSLTFKNFFFYFKQFIKCLFYSI